MGTASRLADELFRRDDTGMAQLLPIERQLRKRLREMPPPMREVFLRVLRMPRAEAIDRHR